MLKEKSSNGETLFALDIDDKFEDFLILVFEKFTEEFTTELDRLGDTFLPFAAAAGLEKILIKVYETQPEMLTIKNELGSTPLHFAADKGLENLLIRVNETHHEIWTNNNKAGKTPLDYADAETVAKIKKLKNAESDASIPEKREQEIKSKPTDKNK